MKKRKDGRYMAQVYLGKKDGKKTYRSVYGSSQREVKEKIAQLKIKQGKGIDIASAEEPFILWANRFIEKKKLDGVGHSHYNNLKFFINYLEPIHQTPLSKVNAASIQGVINTLADWHEDKKPLSKRTLTGIRQSASQVYKMAIGARVVDYNPATYVDIPKTASQTHRDAITDEQRKWIEETEHRAQLPAMIMLYAGLRRGEVTALTKSDIDLEAKTIYVRRAVEYISNQPSLKSTKTAAGDRTVQIPALLVNYLRPILQKDSCLYVVHTKDGKMYSAARWRQVWASYMKDLNLKYGFTEERRKLLNIPLDKEMKKSVPGGQIMVIDTFTPHQLRHTYATMLYHAGVDVLTAKNQLGHKDVRTTLGIYTHLDKNHKKISMEKLDSFLGQSQVSQEPSISNDT